MNAINYTKLWERFAIFPCKAGSKLPATKNGFKDAKTGQDIMQYIRYGYNVALACEMSGLVVIDIDYHDENSTAEDDLRNLEIELGAKLPKTLTQKTASGQGKHLIFSGEGIIAPRGKIGKFCDVKSKGYIMIAPSVYNGKQYEIVDGIDENGNLIIAKLPQVWLDYINRTNTNCENSSADFKDIPKKEYKNLDLNAIFENCNFLNYCRNEDNAVELSEPQWYTMITILAQIEDSDELIHELSEPYPKYSFEETQKKIDNARKFGRPQSCKYISENYPEICQDCCSAVNMKGVNNG